MEDSALENAFDEMIQLVRESRAAVPLPKTCKLKRVSFKTVENLPALLSDEQTASTAFRMSASAMPFSPKGIPQVAGNKQTEDTTGANDAEEDEAAGQIADLGNNLGSFTGERDDVPAQPSKPLASILPLTPAELTAIYMIQRTFRAYKQRRNVMEQQAATLIQRTFRAHKSREAILSATGVPGQRARSFLACFEKAKEIDWIERPRYLFIFLGAVPRILVMLDVLRDRVASDKAKAKRKFNGKTKDHAHMDLDDVSKLYTRAK